MTAAERALADGDPVAAIAALQDEVRGKPGDARLRVFLFQLLCVLGRWDRALTQLDLCAELDALAIPMRETYKPAILCELVRTDVFAGKRSPLLFGEPEAWIALLIESLLREGRGDREAAARLRADAFDAAPPSPGTLDGRPFEWLADADVRLGPVLECVLNGRYSWVPFSKISRMRFEPPVDLRDAVWAPVLLEFINGGEVPALVPARYPGTAESPDGALVLGRKTVWEERDGISIGIGQRMFATPDFEIGLCELRSVVFDAVEAVEAVDGGGTGDARDA